VNVTTTEASDRTEARIRPLGLTGDLGWVVKAHGEIYAAEFGWDTSFEGLVAEIVADFVRGRGGARQAAWIAELGGRRAGCVFCMPGDEASTAKLRILLVDPHARGHGLGGQLVDRAIAFARQAGYRRMQLWTNDPLVAARRLYLSRGFRLIHEQPHRSFGADLIGQTYDLAL
jgi:GNAT superfamily N-acetyltransferase